MIPVFINNPESMVKVRVMTIRDSAADTLKTLQRLGVLQIEENRELAPVDKAAIEQEQREINELLAFVSSILNYVPPDKVVAPEEDTEVIYTRPFTEIADEVRSLYQKVNRLHERTVKLGDQVEDLKEHKRYLEPLLTTQNDISLSDLQFSGDYLFSRVFVVPVGVYETLQDRWQQYVMGSIVAEIDGEFAQCVIGRSKDRRAIESLVAEAGGKTLALPDEAQSLKAYLLATDSRIVELDSELGQSLRELRDEVGKQADRLVLLREALLAESDRLLVLQKASEGRYVNLIEGWAPESSTDSVTAEVRESVDYAFVNITRPQPGEEPPTKLKNWNLLRPFELVVKTFDVPKYGGWDPTPIVAYSFALFFGIMLSDVIYGLILMVVARFLLSRFVDDPTSDGFRLFQRLVYTSCAVAVIFGLLTGTYMGDVHRLLGLGDLALAPPVQRMMAEPLPFIILAILIGLVHVNIAHLLALIKGIQDRNRGVILNRVGLFLLQAGIPVILHSLLGAEFSFLNNQAYSILLYIMLGSLAVIAVSSIMQNGAIGAFFWLFDVTGLFGDVLSYARLAGVGLASFYLGQSFNMVLGLFSRVFPGAVGMVIGTILGVVLFIIGHTLNILLGGMGCFVHSLRLCLVEFLTKFYDGGGKEYSPFKLRKRTAAPVLAKSH